MLITVEAEVDAGGNVRLLEPLEITKTTKAIVTLLENGNDEPNSKGNAQKMLEFLQTPEFRNRRSYPAEKIEAQIQDARNSWE